MAGLFGLFGKKDQDDYYLDQDDAQSFGDAEFMRRPQEVKKTFPKMSGGKAFVPPKISPKTSFESVKTSASSSTNGSFATPSFNNSTPSTPSFNNNTETPSFNNNSSNNTETPSSDNNSNNNNTETPSFNNMETPIQPPSERRKSDTSMDMFRDMAKNMRR